MTKSKEKMSARNLVGLSEFIQKSLISECKFDNINMLVDVAAGNIHKLKLKRPLSSDPSVQLAILAYLDHYDVEVTLNYQPGG